MTGLTRVVGTVALSASALLAQVASLTPADELVIARAKNTLVSELEPGMPKITLEYFLRSEVNAELTWEINDCGEQTGNQSVDKGRDFPRCVEAKATLADGRLVVVMIAVGTMQTNTATKPRLFSMFVSGSRVSLRHLSQLPAELHRDFKRGRPRLRDVPAVPTAPA
ncbi:MAG TPA: hypothetical protein VD837_05095 [Terriglobales bacterium]|nr:hypothetical protein [Terriglobales bacterium]